MVRTVWEADGIDAGTSAGWGLGRPPARNAGEWRRGYGPAGGAVRRLGRAAANAQGRRGRAVRRLPDGDAERPGWWSKARFPRRNGRFTGADRGWRALPSEWYRRAGSLIGAGGPGEPEPFRRIEWVRPRFDQRRDGPSRTGSADRRPRSYGGPDRCTDRAADGRCRA